MTVSDFINLLPFPSRYAIISWIEDGQRFNETVDMQTASQCFGGYEVICSWIHPHNFLWLSIR